MAYLAYWENRLSTQIHTHTHTRPHILLFIHSLYVHLSAHHTFRCCWIHTAISRGAIMISWVFALPCNHINHTTIQSFRCLLIGLEQIKIQWTMARGFKKTWFCSHHRKCNHWWIDPIYSRIWIMIS